MKVTNQSGAFGFDAGGVAEQNTFSIQASGKAFDILSSGLYSRKAEAAVRELACNAVDGHIAAGRGSIPIEVQLPTDEDPTFAVRDTGVGLSRKDVMRLYTTYFASTKAESNDFTGAFGLGSKAPFAYTDSFTVISTHEETVSTYVAAKASDGSPVINLLSEEVVPGAQSGVEVSFPVEPRDFQSFHEAAVRVFRHFAVPPTILGGDSVAPMVYDLSFELKELGAGSRLHVGGESRDYWVVMGNVAYPLNRGAAKLLTVKETTISGLLEGPAGLTLELPIGTVSVAASREELQYDKVSCAALVEASRAALRALRDWVEAQVRRVEETYPGMRGAQLVGFGQLSARFGYLWNAKSLRVLLGDSARAEQLTADVLEIRLAGLTEAVYRFSNKNHRGRILAQWRRMEVTDPVLRVSVRQGVRVILAETSGAERAARFALNEGELASGDTLVLCCKTKSGAEALIREMGMRPADVLVDASTLPPAPEVRREARPSLGLHSGELRVMTLRSNTVASYPADKAMEMTSGFYLKSEGRPIFGSKVLLASVHSSSCLELLLEIVDSGAKYLKEAPPTHVMVLSNTELARLEGALRRANAETEDLQSLTLVDDWVDVMLDLEAMDRDMHTGLRLSMCDALQERQEGLAWIMLVKASALAPEAVRECIKRSFLDADGKVLEDLCRLYDEAVLSISDGDALAKSAHVQLLKRKLWQPVGGRGSVERYHRDTYGVCADAEFIKWRASNHCVTLWRGLPLKKGAFPENAVESFLSQLLIFSGVPLREAAGAFNALPAPADVELTPAQISAEVLGRRVKAKRRLFKVIEGQMSLFERGIEAFERVA